MYCFKICIMARKPKLIPYFQLKNVGVFQDKNSQWGINKMIWLIYGCLVVICVIYMLRLFQLTVFKNSFYKKISENNRLKEILIPAKRGEITDRNGAKIAYDVVSSDSGEFVRYYDTGNLWGHIIGYLQKSSKSQYKSDSCQKKLFFDDKSGQIGIEKAFDCYLRGKKGKMLVEVDANGRTSEIIENLPPIAGEDIQLTISKYLQEKIFDLINQNLVESNDIADYRNQKIAVIATTPNDGELLAMLSYPTFDPNIFTKNDLTSISTLMTDENRPLFNRATSGEYPPGSVFKPMIAAAALESGMVKQNELITDTGEIKVGEQTFGNWYFQKYGKTEGNIDIVKALQRSNDIFFYRLGERLGSTKISEWARKFGFGKSSSRLLEDTSGLIPTDFWKKETLKEKWYQGDNYNTAIGQGYVLTSPLQIHNANQVFANGGFLCQPKIIKKITSQHLDQKSKDLLSAGCQKIGLKNSTILAVKNGMGAACTAGGTGYPFFDFKINVKSANSDSQSSSSATLTKNIQVGCKTGTAQNHLASGKPHAWFSVFAPFENPEIALTILVEESGEGSNVAAPLAKAILKYYFENQH